MRVHVLGERLFCPRMQDAAAAIIYKSLDGVGSSYSDTVVCDLLEIAETEMGYKASEDPLSDRILWLAVQRLEKLQKSGRFVSLLQEHQELAMHLCMRAGSKSWNNRRKSYAGRYVVMNSSSTSILSRDCFCVEREYQLLYLLIASRADEQSRKTRPFYGLVGAPREPHFQ